MKRALEMFVITWRSFWLDRGDTANIYTILDTTILNFCPEFLREYQFFEHVFLCLWFVSGKESKYSLETPYQESGWEEMILVS